MRIRHLFIPVILLLMAGCVKPEAPKDEEPEEQEETTPPDDGGDTTDDGNEGGEGGGNTTPEPVIIAEPFQVHSEIIEQFLTSVSYKERDYSYTHIFDDPWGAYGAPGELDKPNELELCWESSPEGTPLVLTLKEEESGWSAQYSVKAGSTSYKVTNLVPNMSYSYEVKTADENETLVGLGSFKTKGMLHLVYYAGKIRNARDLGGWKTTDGKTVKFRKLYRGGLLNGGYLSSDGKKKMLAEGILAELDLREAGDDASTSSTLGSDILFYNPSIKKAYGTMIRDYPDKVKNSFEFIVRCLREEKPLYFHCSLGRDRTGTITAVILGTLGVSESEMSKEYELLFFSPKDWSLNGGKTEFDYNRTKQWAHKYTCDTIWSLGGKALGVADSDNSVSFRQRAEAYLLSIGVAQKDIDDLRTYMLD
ncbi:MAG: tyrosine-protein phosphatase [Bacteroidales bacterium]|nr:tyrosine-protein phosphatase [Bacteroidales bacterium]